MVKKQTRPATLRSAERIRAARGAAKELTRGQRHGEGLVESLLAIDSKAHVLSSSASLRTALLAAEYAVRATEKGDNLQAVLAGVRSMYETTEGTVTGRLPGTTHDNPVTGRLAAVDYAALEKRLLAHHESERLLVIIVEGDGVPECVLTKWSEARDALCRAVYGLSKPEDHHDAEERERWQRFSDFKHWSVDANGRPFGYVGSTADGADVVHAYFLTSPDVLFMRRA
jgi:hypothetical protein